MTHVTEKAILVRKIQISGAQPEEVLIQASEAIRPYLKDGYMVTEFNFISPDHYYYNLSTNPCSIPYYNIEITLSSTL